MRRLDLSEAKTVRLLLLAILAGGFALLLVETRFEHRVVLAEKWQAWIPIAYSAAVLLAYLLSVAMRRTTALLWCFAAGTGVGLLGFWFHSKGHLFERTRYIVECCLRKPGGIDTSGFDTPPLLAPLAVVGLSLIGVVVCLWGRDRNAGTNEGAGEREMERKTPNCGSQHNQSPG